MKETQRSISDWAWETFGQPALGSRYVERAKEEMRELKDACDIYEAGKAGNPTDARERIVEELADVFIVLYPLAELCGFDLDKAIDKKMRINRMRQWKTDGSGTGQHV